MKKLKDLFEKFLFTVEEVEEEAEDRPEPEPVIEEKPAVKPQPVKKPKVEPVEKPIVRKRNNPVVEEEYEPSPMITLTKEIKTPVLGDEEPVKEVKEEKKAEKEKKIEPELPVIKENKPQQKAREKQNEPYITSAIISPMFGKKEKEAKPVKKKRREIVMPDSELGEKKSVLGTVFSPLYGDKNETDHIPHDEVAPEVASLGVQDFLGGKNEARPEEKVGPIREEVKEPVEDIVIEDMEPVTMTAEELRKNSTITPFGTNVKKGKINIHEAWGSEPKKEEKEIESYENISLFDMDDKM